MNTRSIVSNEISVLIDSNVRSEYYKNTTLNSQCFEQVRLFLDSKNIPSDARNYFIPSTAFYESLGIKKYKLPFGFEDENVIDLKNTKIGSTEEKEQLNIIIEKFFERSYRHLKSDWRLRRKKLIHRIYKQASYCAPHLRKTFLKNYLDKIKNAENHSSFLDTLAFEFIIDASIDGIDKDRIVRFWLGTAIRFLSDERNNSFYRALLKLWTEGHLQKIVKESNLPQEIIQKIDPHVRLKKQGMDLLDSENIHFVTFGRYLIGNKRTKILLLTKDPKLTILHRIAFYKSLLELTNSIAVDLKIKLPNYLEGYVGFLDNHNIIHFVDASEVPPLFRFLSVESYDSFCDKMGRL